MSNKRVLSMIGLACLLMFACLTFTMAGYSWEWNEGNPVLRNQEREAQAARVALAARDEAAARALALRTEQQARPAAVVGKMVFYIGAGVASAVAVVGLAFVGVAIAGKRATTIYPDAKGQYPLIIRRGFGWEVIHDASRSLTPGAVYRTPTLLDVMVEVVGQLRGRSTGLQQPVGEYLPSGSEPAQLQAALSSNAVSLAAAKNRWPDLQLSIGRASLRGEGGNRTQQAPPEVRERMPQITVIDDPARIADYRQYVLEATG